MKTPDFIVIGGGSAGCIVATRLAQANFSTTLLEAGPRDIDPLIHIPAGVRFLLNKKRSAWLDTANAGPKAGNRQINWPHGRVLGGSGSINGMIFIRGQASDFDHWSQLGCSGWDYESVLPAFKSIEKFQGEQNGERGTDGPIPVVHHRQKFESTDVFVEAAQEAGHKLVPDINVGEPEGVAYTQMNRFGRFRGSSARAFLGLGKKTGNLNIVTGAVVDRLEFEDGRCVGVTYSYRGQKNTLRANREIILSAGAIGSPSILQRSGIGDASFLQSLGITVVADRRDVGQNLQDHYGLRLTYRLKNTVTANDLAKMPRLIYEVARYVVAGTGVLTTGVSTGMVYTRSRDNIGYPDIQLSFSPSSFDLDVFGQLEKKPGAILTAAIARPKSRGNVKIRSQDPNDPPKILANYLSDPDDMRVMIEAIRQGRNIMDTSAFSRIMEGPIFPTADVEGADLEEFARNNGASILHPSCTCRMGSDENAVVDSRLCVNGVRGLRVMDASVMPEITSGNTNAPTMMIAEKGAQMILEDHANI